MFSKIQLFIVPFVVILKAPAQRLALLSLKTQSDKTKPEAPELYKITPS
ncbi:MAG: hypothetical protein IJI98_05230 [Methanosphaera sp.]|nr:hypothetical protein [Methanosphaera sp.]